MTATASTGKLDAVARLGADEVVDRRAHDVTALGERWDVVLDAPGVLAVRSLGRIDEHAHLELLAFIGELLAIGRGPQEEGLMRKPTFDRLPLRSVPVDVSTTQGDGSDASGMARKSRSRSTTR